MILSEMGVSNYYSRAEAPTKSAARKVDQIINGLTSDKKEIAKLVDAITDLADAYAEERIENYEADKNI